MAQQSWPFDKGCFFLVDWRVFERSGSAGASPKNELVLQVSHPNQSWRDVQEQRAESRRSYCRDGLQDVPGEGTCAAGTDGHIPGISGIPNGKANPCHLFFTNKILYMAKRRLPECL